MSFRADLEFVRRIRLKSNTRRRTGVRCLCRARAAQIARSGILAIGAIFSFAVVAKGQGSTPPATGLYTLTPCRVADTRDPSGPYGGPALSANSDRTFIFAGRCGIPSTADAVILNVTVTAASAAGDLRIYPAGSSLATASSINYAAGKTRANNGNYSLSSTGGIAVHCDQASGTVQVILDVAGYFETGATPPPGNLWSRRLGDTGDDRVQGIATDGFGNVAVTGHFAGTTNLGGGSVTSNAGSADIFVAEYAPSGGYLWSRVVGGNAPEEGMGAATDPSGNVLVTGYQGSYAVDYGGGVQVEPGGSNDIFVAKYSSAGAWMWSKTIGGYGYDQGNAIAADASGNVFVTGYIGVSAIGVNFGGGALYSAGGSDVFLVKYSAAGAHLWSKRFGSTGNDTGFAVKTDAAGNVFLAGSFEGTVDFGGGALTSVSPPGYGDIFVAKYSASGTHIWSKRFGGPGGSRAYGLAVDSSGDVVVTGKFQSTINFGGSTFTSAGSDDIYLTKLSGATGGHLWSKQFGSTGQDIATGVAVDSGGNFAVAGYFSGSVDFGGGALTSSNIDVFVAKYNSAGGHVWSRRYGGGDNQLADCVSVAPTGEVSVAGFFAMTIDFGTGPLTSAGAYDGFIASIGP